MIFISHSWTNKREAFKALESFSKEGISCWLDVQQLDPGNKLREELLNAISASKVFLYLISKEANESDWVQTELKHALSQEKKGLIKIVPVSLNESSAELPSLLKGRIFDTFDTSYGGVERLANKLSKEVDALDSSHPDFFSTTIRLEDGYISHSLDIAKNHLDSKKIIFLFFDSNYDSLETSYWRLADVAFPKVDSNDDLDAVMFVEKRHKQSRKILDEISKVFKRFILVSSNDEMNEYYQKGYERIIFVLLHRLNENIQYFKSLKEKTGFKTKPLHELYDGHLCEFLKGNNYLGKIKVPKHGHPFEYEIKSIPCWGLSSPFNDLMEFEVGLVVGNLIGHRFSAGTLNDTEMPDPKELKYGLA